MKEIRATGFDVEKLYENMNYKLGESYFVCFEDLENEEE
jgi:hypothetical protein